MRGPGPRAPPPPEQGAGEARGQKRRCMLLWVTLEHIRLGERSQMQKATCCMLPPTGSVQNGRVHTQRQSVGERLHRLGGLGRHGERC